MEVNKASLSTTSYSEASGEVVFQLQIDTYHIKHVNVGTVCFIRRLHLLAHNDDVRALRQARAASWLPW